MLTCTRSGDQWPRSSISRGWRCPASHAIETALQAFSEIDSPARTITLPRGEFDFYAITDGQPYSSGTPHSNASDTTSTAIAILSNLLGANIDVGLKYCLQLGYHDDVNLRIGFMRIIITILQNGTRFGALGAKRVAAGSRPFTDLVCDPNLALAIAACEACPSSETDEFLPVVFRLFESNGSVLSLMKGLVEREVAQTSESHRYLYLWHTADCRSRV